MATMPRKLQSWLDIEDPYPFPIEIKVHWMIPKGKHYMIDVNALGFSPSKKERGYILYVSSWEERQMFLDVWREMPGDDRASILEGMKIADEMDAAFDSLYKTLGNAEWN